MTPPQRLVLGALLALLVVGVAVPVVSEVLR
jgi:hypothetical protein